MPSLFLEPNTSFSLLSTATAFGAVGNSKEIITLPDNQARDVIIYPSIERVEFASPVADYQFQIAGNIANVMIDGHTLVQLNLDNQMQLAFADGTVDLTISGLNQAKLANVSLPTQAQNLTGVLLDTTDVSTVAVVQNTTFSVNPSTQTVLEGALGSSTIANFSVTRSGNLNETSSVSLNVNSANSTAQVNQDFIDFTSLLNFAVGESEKNFAITLIGDDRYENDETLNIQVNNTADNSLIGEVVISIINDDPLPTLTLSRAPAENFLGILSLDDGLIL